jgi:hypothetical protein
MLILLTLPNPEKYLTLHNKQDARGGVGDEAAPVTETPVLGTR